MSTNSKLMLQLEHKEPNQFSFGPNARPYVSGGGALKKKRGGVRTIAKHFGAESGVKTKLHSVGQQGKTVKRNARRMELRKSGGGKK